MTFLLLLLDPSPVEGKEFGKRPFCWVKIVGFNEVSTGFSDECPLWNGFKP